MSFKAWREARLGEFITIKHGYAFDGKSFSEERLGRPIIVNIGNFDYSGGFRFDKTKVRECIGEYPEEYILKPGDILLAMTCQTSGGEILGIPGVIPDDGNVYLHNQRLGKVIIKKSDEVTADFIYYLCLWSNFKHELFVTATGTKILHTAPDRIENFKCLFPPLKEQKEIVNILSVLDKKIEANIKINKKLEEMAQAIFKHWFVDFEFPNENGKPYKSSSGEMVESGIGMIPRGWKVTELGEVLSTIEAGNRPKGGAGNLVEGIPSIGAENIIGLGKYDYSKEKFVTEEYFQNMNKGAVKSGDVLLYKDGAQIGRKTMFMDGYPHEKCCINSHVFILRTNEFICQSYLYFWLDQDYMTQNIINLNANSAQPGINQVQVKSLKILIPDKSVVDRFDAIISSLLKKIFSNCNTNKNLAKLRDTLLPKFMSGEIRVPLDN